jgi:hypothetical protein
MSARKHHLFSNYGDSLGKAKRAKLTDITSSRIDNLVFEDEKGYEMYNDDAAAQLSNFQLQNRQRRDMAMDLANPREELPKDIVSERAIDQNPDFKPQVVDLSLPSDYKARDQVKLVQDGRANFILQSNMYDTPDFHSSGEGLGSGGVAAPQGYSLGAAGLKTNRFTEDQDGTQINSIDNVQAF